MPAKDGSIIEVLHMIVYGNNMDAKQRKERPVYTGVLKYFPDAIMEVAKVSLAGNQQHHPDKPLHWIELRAQMNLMH